MYQNVALYFDVIHLKMFHKLENVKVMPIVILNFTVVNVFLAATYEVWEKEVLSMEIFSLSHYSYILLILSLSYYKVITDRFLS